MLKTVLSHIFVETMILFLGLLVESKVQNNHLIDAFVTLMSILSLFYQFNVSLLNKTIHFFQKKLLTPKFVTVLFRQIEKREHI